MNIHEALKLDIILIELNKYLFIHSSILRKKLIRIVDNDTEFGELLKILETDEYIRTTYHGKDAIISIIYTGKNFIKAGGYQYLLNADNNTQEETKIKISSKKHKVRIFVFIAIFTICCIIAYLFWRFK